MCVGVGSHDLEGGFNSPSRRIVHAINLVLCIVKDSRVRQCYEGSSDGDADVESPQLHCFYRHHCVLIIMVTFIKSWDI
jgi:hypothetical protein